MNAPTKDISALTAHLVDLRKTVTTFINLGVEYRFPDYCNICELSFDTGTSLRPVSNFLELLIWNEILIKKSLKHDVQENLELFVNSIQQAEVIIVNSLFHAEIASVDHLYHFIFKNPSYPNGYYRYDERSIHRYNIVYFAIRHAIQLKLNNQESIDSHIRILNKIYTKYLAYDILALIWSFKFFSFDELYDKKSLLGRLEKFHELIWTEHQDLTLPKVPIIIDCSYNIVLEVYAAKNVVVFDKKSEIYHNYFGYFLSLSDKVIYPMNPSNDINNTFLSYAEIFVQAVQYGLFRGRNKIIKAPDSNYRINLTKQELKDAPILSDNSYIIANDKYNWYHFVLDIIFPLYQIVISRKLFFKNIIVPSSIYDNKNMLQLITSVAEMNVDNILNIIRLDQVTCAKNLHWSSITYPLDYDKNSLYLFDRYNYSIVHLLADFSDAIQSCIRPKKKINLQKIYLKRSSSLRRECQNIEEVENLVENHFCFEPIELEKYSFCEQVSILNNCNYIVGPTGAAWVNILFCNRQTNVRAVCWGVEKKDCWPPLARSSNVQLKQLYANDSNSYYLDCSNLATVISQMLDS